MFYIDITTQDLHSRDIQIKSQLDYLASLGFSALAFLWNYSNEASQYTQQTVIVVAVICSLFKDVVYSSDCTQLDSRMTGE
jgi:hypothetical protein